CCTAFDLSSQPIRAKVTVQARITVVVFIMINPSVLCGYSADGVSQRRSLILLFKSGYAQ
ncbi:MAG: hypothetical protein Q2484_06740, partial [Candidatus Sedimenticola sp. (ex Thyasira tokunagai)]